MIPAALQAYLDDLRALERADRIEMLIAIGEEFRNPSPADFPRTDADRIPGCESEAFVARAGGHYRFAVDNPQGISAMAMARILEQGTTGADVAQIAAIPDDVVFDIFGRELSMGKNLGLANMVRRVKFLATR